jgi:hypothetical protein
MASDAPNKPNLQSKDLMRINTGTHPFAFPACRAGKANAPVLHVLHGFS